MSYIVAFDQDRGSVLVLINVVHGNTMGYRYSKMSSSANTSRRRGILKLLLHISKMVWHEHINFIFFHMQISFLNSGIFLG